MGYSIAVTADPYIPVPPLHYGGIERIVDLLVRGLSERGHHVTLFAHADSRASARLVPYGAPPHQTPLARLQELWQLGSELWFRRGEYDLVHSFGRLAALLPILPLRGLPKLQSYQRECPWNGIEKARLVAGESLHFTACASHMYQDQDGGSGFRTIFNGVDMTKYNFAEKVAPEAPLVFLGRLERIKGAHHAVTIAKRSGRRLVIAGNRVDSLEGRHYFDREIHPQVDGELIQYLGPVDDVQKNELLGQAGALLMPIEWEEPFGIVVAEALACGTPVIGFARGSLPEIVQQGRTGFLCDDIEEAVRAIGRLGELDRKAARQDAEARFSAPVIVDAYERLYQELLEA